MSKQRIILIIILVLIVVAGGLAIALNQRWNKPLGPALELPTRTSSAGSMAQVANLNGTVSPLDSNPVVTTTQSSDNQPLSTVNPYPVATSHPLCGGPDTLTILLVGSDQRGTGYKYGLADSIHILRVDFTKPGSMMIDFPRDLWVEIPDIADHYGITHGKLNQAYLYGNPGMGYYDGPGEGPGLLARTLELNFGLRVDHYLAIDLQTFERMIDAIGGVDIMVDKPIDLSYGVEDPGPEYFLAVGKQHLDGKRALILVRNRIPSTFQRMKYQQMILDALREKLLSREMLPKLPKLVAEFIGAVQTDLSLREINNLLCIAQVIPKENIQADSFPRSMFKASDIYDSSRDVHTFIYEADFDEIRTMVAKFMSGIWPFP